ncbi:hypothetical protein L3Y34_016293 [Caenorhabditis briggsae]|uniref:F-box domain-containing protein n=1 Tax=Caenorhabditis briggsae TaxID=6238 RepID=A0AAE9DZR2_CAEBR|nr:hypothetical protein L3Y34_016293 [Caenorhabditis briggsae]
MHRFPLLSLPELVLQEVLENVSSADAFELYQCSKNASKVLRKGAKGQKYFKVVVDFSQAWLEIHNVRRYTINEKTKTDPHPDDSLELKTFGESAIEYKVNALKEYHTYCEEGEKIVALQKIADHFMKTLGVDVFAQVFIGLETPAMEVIDWIQNSNLKYETFNINGSPEEPLDAVGERIYTDKFLETIPGVGPINTTGTFVSMINVKQGFQPVNFLKKPLTMLMFHLHHSHFITGKHLMALNCTAIALKDSRLTAADINAYLTAWKKGNYPVLMHLLVQMTNGYTLDLKEVVKGLVNPNAITNVTNGQEVVFTRESGDEMAVTLTDNDRYLSVWVEEYEKP